MRTTIQIDDHLFAELKKTAADTGRTMSATIQDALREALYRPREAKRLPAELPVFHGTGLMPGVDLNDFAALAIESGCEWITLDRDFARFEGLRWSRPPRH